MYFLQLPATNGDAERSGYDALIDAILPEQATALKKQLSSVLDPANLEVLRSRCVTVWLRVSEEAVLRRLEDPTSPQRPLLEPLEPGIVVHKLLVQREPLYAQADFVVETDGRTVQEVADAIIRELGIPTTGA